MYFPQGEKEQIQRHILARLKKIEGQMRGLQGMVADGRDCEQIMTQVRAAQSALNAVARLILQCYLLKCFSEVGEKPSPEQVMQKLDKLVTMLAKFIGS